MGWTDRVVQSLSISSSDESARAGRSRADPSEMQQNDEVGQSGGFVGTRRQWVGVVLGCATWLAAVAAPTSVAGAATVTVRVPSTVVSQVEGNSGTTSVTL